MYEFSLCIATNKITLPKVLLPTPEFTVDTTVGRTVLIESVWSCDLALVISTHSLF